MIYSLIPAKVKSSRLPGKNTFKFLLGDKPLIAYTIAELFKVNFQPFVFTNESNIENTFGAKIIERSEDLSGSQTTMKETVEAFVNKMNLKNQDTILLTYLTCPFRSAESIKRALKLYEHTGARSLQSLTAVDYRPYGLMKRSKRNEHNYYCLQEQANY
ncbi:MAG: N-acylneuraminate cytidylyltransferase, partial [Bacteroidota bacterium]